MKITRILAIITLITFAALAMAGCGAKSDQQAANVDVFQFKVEFKDAFEKLAKTYMAGHPNVKINITTVGGGSDYGAALKAKFASGAEPAIFNIGGPQDVKDWQAKIVELGDTSAAKIAADGTLIGSTRDGKIYGLPFCLESYGLIYNKAIFKKAGIDTDKIKTFAALEAAVKTLDSKKAELGIQAVFAYPMKETWVTGLHTGNAFMAAA